MQIPVLVEKPVATSVQECQRILDVSHKSGVLMAAGMTRRFFRSDRLVRQMIQSGLMGELKHFEVENGYEYGWKSASNFILSKAQAGGGVLMGLGSHALDSMIWFLGQPSSTVYKSDAAGGIESECVLEFVMPNGARGTMELSRSRNLKNHYLFEFEKGTICAPFYGDEIRICFPNGDLGIRGKRSPTFRRRIPRNRLQK